MQMPVNFETEECFMLLMSSTCSAKSNLPLKLFFCSAGFRIGKGEGFADMEYGMMASMGAVSDSTVVVTIVHDCQVHSFLLFHHHLIINYNFT